MVNTSSVLDERKDLEFKTPERIHVILREFD